MTATDLVQQLRCRNELPRFIVDTLPDEAIIESYIRCADCGDRFIDDIELSIYVAKAHDADEFLALVSQHTCEPYERQEQMDSKKEARRRKKMLRQRRRR